MHKTFDQVYGEPTSPFYYGVKPSEKLATFLSKNTFEIGSALDLGCGEGRNTLLLAHLGFQVDALDASAGGIRKLERYVNLHNICNIYPTVADATKWVPKPQYYEAIVAATLLDHLTKEDGFQVAQMILTSLKPDGFAFVEVFTCHDPGALAESERSVVGNASDTAYFIKHYFDDGELAEWFSPLEFLLYEEKKELDESHGTPHYHGTARMIGRKKRSS